MDKNLEIVDFFQFLPISRKNKYKMRYIKFYLNKSPQIYFLVLEFGR